MKGDFSRITFDPDKRFSRVLLQQGRVLLDADFNEQVSIFWAHLRAVMTDLIGWHAGPGDDPGFEVRREGQHLVYEGGVYYVNGLRIEAERTTVDPSLKERFVVAKMADLDAGKHYLAYLSASERHVNAVEDNPLEPTDASIVEVALGGLDTASRARVEWRVGVVAFDTQAGADAAANDEGLLRESIEERENALRPRMRARAGGASGSTEPCLASPEAKYRGLENQLYRIELHRSGKAWDGNESTRADAATFKWSRENGSVVLPIQAFAGTVAKVVTLELPGRDAALGLSEGDWVELVNDDLTADPGKRRAGHLQQVASIDRARMEVHFEDEVEFDGRPELHPYLRRWDQRAGDPESGGLQLEAGAVLLEEGRPQPFLADAPTQWLELEDGVQVEFVGAGAVYRARDYWIVPARVATENVEWPGPPQEPAALHAHGPKVVYAPLSRAVKDQDPVDLRRRFTVPVTP